MIARIAAIALVATLAACGDDDAAPPEGFAYRCGAMMCHSTEACVREYDDVERNDYSCKEEVGCLSPGRDYCPGAEAAFCEPFEVEDPDSPDGGTVTLTGVQCRYRPP